MKQLSCGAVVSGCAAVFHGETTDDILRQAADHAREDHAMHEIPPAVAQEIRANIVDV